jgi:hypothetical protein
MFELLNQSFITLYVHLAERIVTATAGNGIEFERANYLQTELSSLGIECKRKNELNDYEELQALTTAIKGVYFQDYKTAYNTSNTEIDQSHFDHLI